MWRSSVFPGGQPRPHPKGAGPSVPNFWDLPPARVRSPAMWATNQPGDSQLGDTFLVNWATDVETTGPQLWKCERLTIAVLEQLCAVLIGQRPFNITHRTNLPHSSLECYEVAGLIDASQCSVNQTAQVVSQPISDFLPTILVDTLVTILCRRPLITACYGEVILDMVGEVVLHRVSVEVPNLHSASNSYEYTSTTIKGLYTTITYIKSL